MSADEVLLNLTLPSRPEAAAVVRRELARVLPADRISDHGLAELELLASELVANAVRHGQPGTIAVKIMRTPTHVRLEVTNPGSLFSPPPERDADAAGGFGIPLIRRLSSRWRIEPAAGAVTVWIEYTDSSRPGA